MKEAFYNPQFKIHSLKLETVKSYAIYRLAEGARHV